MFAIPIFYVFFLNIIPSLGDLYKSWTISLIDNFKYTQETQGEETS